MSFAARHVREGNGTLGLSLLHFTDQAPPDLNLFEDPSTCVFDSQRRPAELGRCRILIERAVQQGSNHGQKPQNDRSRNDLSAPVPKPTGPVPDPPDALPIRKTTIIEECIQLVDPHNLEPTLRIRVEQLVPGRFCRLPLRFGHHQAGPRGEKGRSHFHRQALCPHRLHGPIGAHIAGEENLGTHPDPNPTALVFQDGSVEEGRECKTGRSALVLQVALAEAHPSFDELTFETGESLHKQAARRCNRHLRHRLILTPLHHRIRPHSIPRLGGPVQPYREPT